VLEEQSLQVKLHDRAGFCCGVPALDDYLRRFAAQQSAKGMASVYVLVDDLDPSRILGFYTLSAAQVDARHLIETDRKRMPRYPIPCFRMDRLACRSDHQGRGLGQLQMGCAVERCLKARSLVGAYALLVDAKDENAKAFYRHYGLTACVDSPMMLYLPLG